MELGSAGVSTNIFNYVSKLFNIPLLSVATSFVAEDISKNESEDSASGEVQLMVDALNFFCWTCIWFWFYYKIRHILGSIPSCSVLICSDCCTEGGCLGGSTNGKPFNGVAERKQLASVSTALLLAVGIGIIEALALYFGSGKFLDVMGLSSVSFCI